jgi:DNA-binding PadR family transcriptional regulator
VPRSTLNPKPAPVPPASTNINPTQGSILGFLYDAPKTGWDLLQEISATLSRFWSITPSHLYRELHNLERLGLVTGRRRGSRDKKPYKITKAGKAAFSAWIAQEPGREQIRFPLLVTLWFGRHVDPDTLAMFVAREREHHEHRLAKYEEIAAHSEHVDRHTAAVIAFGVHYERAVLDWLTELDLGGVRRGAEPSGRRG